MKKLHQQMGKACEHAAETDGPSAQGWVTLSVFTLTWRKLLSSFFCFYEAEKSCFYTAVIDDIEILLVEAISVSNMCSTCNMDAIGVGIMLTCLPRS